MWEKRLRRFREQVRAGDYVVTVHADEEMDADGLSVIDIEAAVLQGRVVDRQRDPVSGEAKFVIQGPGLDGRPVAVVVKSSPIGRMVVLTVYRD